MSDTTTDTFVKMMEATFDAAPSAPDLPTAPDRHRSRRRPAVALAFGFMTVLLLAGAGAAIVGFSAPNQWGHAVTSIPELTPLRFDTTPLGTEVVAQTDGAQSSLDISALEATVHEQIDPGYVLSGDPTFLGGTEGIEGFAATFTHPTLSNLMCQVEVRDPDVYDHSTGFGLACGPETDQQLGIVVDSTPRFRQTTVIASSWSPEAAVIAVEFQTGERYWQRTHNAGAALVMPVALPDHRITPVVTALDADGRLLGSTEWDEGSRSTGE